MYGGKKRKSGNSTQDSDEEEDLDNMESKEVDYMSESSSGKMVFRCFSVSLVDGFMKRT